MQCENFATYPTQVGLGIMVSVLKNIEVFIYHPMKGWIVEWAAALSTNYIFFL